LPTIRLFNEASHRFLPQNHEKIITASRRFYKARVKLGSGDEVAESPFDHA
jgi:hypothetical protein